MREEIVDNLKEKMDENTLNEIITELQQIYEKFDQAIDNL